MKLHKGNLRPGERYKRHSLTYSFFSISRSIHRFGKVLEVWLSWSQSHAGITTTCLNMQVHISIY